MVTNLIWIVVEEAQFTKSGIAIQFCMRAQQTHFLHPSSALVPPLIRDTW